MRAAGTPSADTLVVSRDAGLQALAERLLPELAARSGLALRRPVRVEYRTREQLERYLAFKLDEDLPPARAAHMVEVYSRLGLMDGDTDLRRLLVQVYREQVAGFYDPDSTALFVMDDQPAGDVEAVLLHELVHAVQDQSVDLGQLTDPSRGNDRTMAAQAAMEGHATLVMMEYQVERMQGRSLDLTTVPGFAAQLRAQMSGMADGYPALSAAPRIIRDGMLFPYLDGSGFILEAWRRLGERPAALATLVPQSTEQVLDPERFLDEPGDPPLVVEILPAGAETLYGDNLGRVETGIFLEELAGSAAGAAAAGWGGDAYVLADSPAGRTLIWATVWDDAGARDRFVAEVEVALPYRLEDAAISSREVAGHPAAVLTVGPPLEVELRVRADGGDGA
jgi:hypothetical protein